MRKSGRERKGGNEEKGEEIWTVTGRICGGMSEMCGRL